MEKIVVKLPGKIYGLRAQGEPIRKHIQELVDSNRSNDFVYIDFANVEVIDWTWADDVIGKLIDYYTPSTFLTSVKFINSADSVAVIIKEIIGNRVTEYYRKKGHSA